MSQLKRCEITAHFRKFRSPIPLNSLRLRIPRATSLLRLLNIRQTKLKRVRSIHRGWQSLTDQIDSFFLGIWQRAPSGTWDGLPSAGRRSLLHGGDIRSVECGTIQYLATFALKKGRPN